MKRSKYSAVMSMWSGLSNQSCERKRRGGVGVVIVAASRTGAVPAGVDVVVAAGAARRVVGGEEQRHRRDVLRLDALVQALFGEDLLFAFGRVPQRHLALRLDRAGDDAVDADAVFAEVARQAARQAFDGGFGGHVQRQVAQGQVPRDRTEVQDHAAAGRFHAGCDGLRAEELVAQVDSLVVVPVFGGDVGDLMAVVVGGVVDQDVDGAVLLRDAGEGGRQRIEVGQVAVVEGGWYRRAAQIVFELARGVVGDVDEEDVGALFGEGVDQGRADAGAAAGDHHALAGQAGVDGVSHRLAGGRLYRGAAHACSVFLFVLLFSRPRWARLWYSARTP